MNKKGFVIFLSAIFLFSIVGCGEKSNENVNNKENNVLSETKVEKEEDSMKNSESPQDNQKEDSSYIKGEVLLKFNPEVDSSNHEKIIKEYNCSIKNVIESLNVYRVEIPKDKTVPEMVDILSKDNRVKYAEPNIIYKVQE